MKIKSRPQYYRVRRILELIRDGMRNNQLANCTLFVDELNVSRQTVMSDIEFLRTEENAPIEYVSAKFGYLLTDEFWELPSVQLSSRELFAFSIAKKVLNNFVGTALETDIESLMSKITESLEGKVSFDLERMADKFIVIGEDHVEQDPQLWFNVADSLNNQQRISIVYQKFDGAVSDYLIEPYHLLAYHGNWYVLARNVQKKMVVTFAVSRIKSLKRKQDYFDVPQDFNINDHITSSFGIVRGEKSFKVRLSCSPKIASYIKERNWQSGQIVKERRDGSIELLFETAGWKELVRWILSWQPDMKVLAPKILKDRIEEKMREAISEMMEA